MMPGVNYVIYGCFFVRATPGVSLYQSLTLEGNIIAVITQDSVIDDSLKTQVKNQTLCTCRLFLLTQIFNILAIGQKYFSFYLPSLFKINS